MAPSYFEPLNVKRATVVSLTIKAIQDDSIPDISPPDITDMSSLRLAYLVLRHSSQYNSDYHEDSDLTSTVEWQKKFLRMQRFALFIHEHPPIQQHQVLIKSVHKVLHDHPDLWQHSASHMELLINDCIQKYITSLEPIATSAIQSDVALKRYMNRQQRFFVSPQSPDYDPEDFDSDEYHEYMNTLDLLQIEVDTIRPINYFTQFIMSSALFDAQSTITEADSLPLICNAFPNSIATRWQGRSAWLKTKIRPRAETKLEDQLSTTEVVENTLSHYFVEDPFISIKVSESTTIPSTPFPGFAFHRPHVPPPPTGSTPGASGSNPPPPPPTGPPPPTPSTPDDSAYQPNASLSFKMKDIVDRFQALTTMDMEKDHMTRFSTTNEIPIPTSPATVRRGDIPIFAGKNKFSQKYIVTFTRKSRKPIFNPVN